jgi:hypothetical protein
MKANHVWNRAFVRRWLVGAALAFSVLSASAFNGDRYTDMEWNVTGAGSATATPRTPGGTPSYSAHPGGPVMKGTKKLPWPGKAEATNMAKWKMQATPRAMAKAVVNPIGMLAGFGITAVLGTLLDEACIRIAGGAMVAKEGAAWEECKMVTGMVRYYYTPAYDPATKATSREGSCLKKAATLNPSYVSVVVQLGPDSYMCKIYTDSGGYVNGWGIDYYDLPGSYQNGWQPVSPQIAEDKLTTAIEQKSAEDVGLGKTDDALTARALKDLTEAWKVELGTIVLEGPENYVGLPSTELNVLQSIPTGGTQSVTTTVATTTADKYTYTYDGDKVTAKKETTTTTTLTVGTDPAIVKTETKTEDAKDETDTQSECEKSPDTLGCAKLDTPEIPVPKSTKNVDYAPDDLGFGSGSCPSPISGTAAGRTYTISYQPMCDLATNILRPVLLAMAALMSYFMVVGGVKGD